MERKKSLIAVSVIVLALCTLVAVSLPQGAEAASLKQRLSAAKKGLRDATRRLRAAEGGDIGSRLHGTAGWRARWARPSR